MLLSFVVDTVRRHRLRVFSPELPVNHQPPRQHKEEHQCRGDPLEFVVDHVVRIHGHQHQEKQHRVGKVFNFVTWNNRHGEAADNLERANDSPIPLAGHLEVKRSRERKYFCVLDIFFP